MTSRGVKFLFTPGEHVLCFEPDPTKARVLYHAKILDTNIGRDVKRGKRMSEYLIHFQGWNSSWDRIVAEQFVLKDTDENQALMKRLATLARNVKRNRSRKKKIDDILKITLCDYHDRFTSQCSDSSSEENSSDDDDDDLEEEMDVEEEEDEYEKTKKEEKRVPYPAIEEFILKEPRKIELPVPSALKKKLEDDAFFILRKRKLLKLPAEPNVITILEGYVKHLAINILCATVEKQKPFYTRQANQPERSVELCKEVMDSLRIYFDFTLPIVLLYNIEKTQFTKLSTSFKPVITNMKREGNREAAPVMPPSPVSSPRTRASARLQTPTTPTPAADPYPKIPRLSPKHRRDDSPKHLKEEPIESDTPTRRMTRHSYANEIQRQSETPSGESKKGQGSEVKRKEPKRSRLSLSLSSSRSSTVSSTTASLSQRVTPPPPLLIPNIISSKCVESRNAPSVKSQQSTPIPLHNGLEGSESDGGLNDVLCWKIIPDEVYAQTPTPPSIIYGAPHLLRLFVRLPELLGKMNIPEVKLKPLIKHLELFLDYLSDNSEVFFPETMYMDASQCYNSSRQSSAHK